MEKDIYPGCAPERAETGTRSNAHPQISMAERRTQLECPVPCTQIHKGCYIHTTECHQAIERKK